MVKASFSQGLSREKNGHTQVARTRRRPPRGFLDLWADVDAEFAAWQRTLNQRPLCEQFH